MTVIRLAISIICAGLACGAAHGQLQSERLDGHQRVCAYRDTVGTHTNAGGTREHRVGIAENCPLLPPNPGSAPLPPTARLTEDVVEGTGRRCTYRQGGLTWQATIAVDRACPLAAGMLPEERREQR